VYASENKAAWWVLLSGGYDSATVLASAVAAGVKPRSLFIDYGQPGRHEETAAAAAIAQHYGSAHRELTLDGLDVGDGEIKGRNAALCAIALTAITAPATVALGIHRGTPYWDCTPSFLEQMQALADGYTNGALQFSAPIIDGEKADIYALGEELTVPRALTYSCERGGSPCGACASCLDVKAHARP
jgi:7-cyano-7-deazaguanine synthase